MQSIMGNCFGQSAKCAHASSNFSGDYFIRFSLLVSSPSFYSVIFTVLSLPIWLNSERLLEDMSFRITMMRLSFFCINPYIFELLPIRIFKLFLGFCIPQVSSLYSFQEVLQSVIPRQSFRIPPLQVRKQ